LLLQAPVMKYRHSFHAGNFADVHKHVTLLALLAALKRKDKGFLYLETHAARGAYELASAESALGIGKLARSPCAAPELRAYTERVSSFRAETHNSHAYPGSPLLACRELRQQDRGVLIEQVPAEAAALERALEAASLAARVRVERGNGFELLRASLPPAERRGLMFIDPPYEETREDFARVSAAIAEALRRFATGVIATWYPIKDERLTVAWQGTLARTLECEAFLGELWLYPRDARVALNGSGMLVVNPPYLVAEQMQKWLPELLKILEPGPSSGVSIRRLR
jgi:23S rRNA (adenine2030-N6)-methyltransferase